MKNSNHYTVYCHTNKINGKRYVGITGRSVNVRWANGRGYVRCVTFYNAIKKYGWNNFNHEILHENISKKDAEQLEIKYIKDWKLTDREYGYNILPGGYIFNPTEEVIKEKSEYLKKYYEERPEEKERLRLLGIKRFESEESRNAASKRTKEIQEKNPELVKIAISNLSKFRKERWEKPIKCIELDRVFSSIREASIETKISYCNIRSCSIGIGLTAGGYHWEYVKEKDKIYAKKKREEYLKLLQNTPTRKVYCVELDKTWRMCAEAERELNLPKGSVYKSCERKTKCVGKYTFEFVVSNPIKILCVETNQVFSSQKEAGEALGIKYFYTIGDVCRGTRKSYYGYTFRYIEEENIQ